MIKLHIILFGLFMVQQGFAQGTREIGLPGHQPLIGRWVVVDEHSAADIIEEEPTMAIRFFSGERMSMFGCGVFDDEEDANSTMLGCPSYFVPVLEGNKISGTLSDTYIPVLVGAEISFTWSVDEKTGILTIGGASSVGYYRNID